MVLKRLSRHLRTMPAPMLLAMLYGTLIIIGTLLLKLPISTRVHISWIDAIFTATSAVTICGLAVVDIGADLSPYGQLVVLGLVQVSGLGIMTFTVLILAALGLPIGLTGRTFLRDDLSRPSLSRILQLVGVIFQAVVAVEAIGAIVLSFIFVPVYGLVEGVWYGVFHSVMAFNNAGMTNLPGGMVPWATHPAINLVIPLMVIIGGLGYAVISDVVLLRKWRKFSLNSKLMLSGTAGLLILSMGAFAILEWSNPATLGQYANPGDRLMISWFQAVTPRSGGFNTTEIGEMHPATTLMFLALMMIGGGPTSTAGGLKVTTFLVVLLATLAFFRRRTELQAFGRSIGLEQVLKVMALTTISCLIVFVGVFLLMATNQGDFLDVSFEVVSAVATTGLSRGLTPELDGFGKLLVSVLMFVGRVGPVTLGFFITTQLVPKVRYPSGQIYLG